MQLVQVNWEYRRREERKSEPRSVPLSESYWRSGKGGPLHQCQALHPISTGQGRHGHLWCAGEKTERLRTLETYRVIGLNKKWSQDWKQVWVHALAMIPLVILGLSRRWVNSETQFTACLKENLSDLYFQRKVISHTHAVSPYWIEFTRLLKDLAPSSEVIHLKLLSPWRIKSSRFCRDSGILPWWSFLVSLRQTPGDWACQTRVSQYFALLVQTVVWWRRLVLCFAGCWTAPVLYPPDLLWVPLPAVTTKKSLSHCRRPWKTGKEEGNAWLKVTALDGCITLNASQREITGAKGPQDSHTGKDGCPVVQSRRLR